MAWQEEKNVSPPAAHVVCGQPISQKQRRCGVRGLGSDLLDMLPCGRGRHLSARTSDPVS